MTREPLNYERKQTDGERSSVWWYVALAVEISIFLLVGIWYFTTHMLPRA